MPLLVANEYGLGKKYMIFYRKSTEGVSPVYKYYMLLKKTD